MTKPHALVVDDEPDICELLAITLERMGIQADTCGDVTCAKDRLSSHNYQLCLTDMELPDGDGLELVEWMQNQGLTIPVAIITAHGNIETAVRALKLGAFDFISKPVNLQDLRKLVDSAMRLSTTDAGETKLLGKSDAINNVCKMIAKVARSQAPVHITGESGTGKELVAQMIHEQSSRQNKPFTPVNCGAIPSELMESELFGHKKGSFTGAVSDKSGLFQSAEGGTLFLDEIADLPLSMQVKLLRVIQEKTVRPIGQAEEVSIDVRILSATHKNLDQLVKTGQFREDLYYRINVIELNVPPLRERGNDIFLLSEHILARLAADMQIPPPTLGAEAQSKLMGYHFPGNVRELENTLERAITLSEDNTIKVTDILLKGGSKEVKDPAETTDLGKALDDVERTAIMNALEETRFNKTAAAKKLGLSLRALRYRIQKLNID
ncbi:MAG: sigma-54-dependent Fis family transcriptional regulator [Gammaproteobacteria bacterium]|nr:sigma-54-dependent Fis family transcriptional regulator [Gammaproteobacteria bacterium]MCP4088625.1 sigma-54-dependent Fis family transcriptional regulator [Gammaproteobacteria bacterium]MCP4276467.1 sigma-54-dependent Fis family transcriptional regulator [Gammaproteobacteria bacterium]MCP4832344.1 sigma-54-dependent Fis family transcriptional regulator [Gammaproteobacteria bacterium]MCP4929142.1 sigma-54-dependent Fis family transcriptional regulator [Gammaproteobacteria bacterium]